MKKNNSNKTGMNPKRIAAIAGIVLLAALYVITLIVAIADKSASGTWFFLCLIGTVTIPLLVWIYTWMYGMLTQKHTIASFDLLNSEEEETAAEKETSQN